MAAASQQPVDQAAASQQPAGLAVANQPSSDHSPIIKQLSLFDEGAPAMILPPGAQQQV